MRQSFKLYRYKRIHLTSLTTKFTKPSNNNNVNSQLIFPFLKTLIILRSTS